MEKRFEEGGTEKKRGHRYRFQLPIKEFVKGDEKDLKVPPYVMGVWLGDGTNQANRICASPKDISVLDKCAEYYNVSSETVHKDTGVIYRYYKGLNFDLRTYGMCEAKERREKRIPQEYLTASKRQETHRIIHRRSTRIIIIRRRTITIRATISSSKYSSSQIGIMLSLSAGKDAYLLASHSPPA